MSVITLRIDASEVAVPAGASLLEACRAAGVALPTLCHLEGLTPVGACRLCLVEVDGAPRPLPACACEASEGQVVHTDTPVLREYRRMAVELFFAEGNHVCAVCVANGDCGLQDAAVAVGMDHSRFPYQAPRRGVDASHPQFALDHNRRGGRWRPAPPAASAWRCAPPVLCSTRRTPQRKSIPSPGGPTSCASPATSTDG